LLQRGNILNAVLGIGYSCLYQIRIGIEYNRG
jgi:CRISPR/Cas system-associated endonuclease Cas1